jgi:L-ribulokinase
MADITGVEIRIDNSEQTCALGAAMFAATAAGVYKNVESAMKAMGPGFEKIYHPDTALGEVYDKRYQQYKSLGKSIEDLSLKIS